MDYLRKYLAGQPGDSQPTGAETVERLCERVRTSTLLDDRRDAVRGLKALSRKFCLEVGTQSMDILANVLQSDRSDAEITGYALETLSNVMSNDPPDDENEIPYNVPEDLGGQFTEIFIKKADNVTTLLSLLEEYDFHVRWPTVKLLTTLLINRSRDLQDFILVSPMGVSKLMDLLSDSREVIRNDALLLLTHLTKGNASIQKIVAFENGFERLLDIVKEEGSSDGGIVVEDCLLLLLNLLTNNSSNQTFFKESSYIQCLTPYFVLETNESQVGWSAQKVTNIHLMLQLIRTLVSPNNPQQQTAASQKVMYTCGLLQQLCRILMTSGVPADVLTETINTVSEVIRGNQINQEYFASVMAPSSPPRPAIVVLLMSMVNEKQPFVLRCAVLYCFQSFLHKNDIGQLQIVQTLLPTSADANTITAGQLLCSGLFSTDSLSNWLAAVALLHAILDNPTQKEQLLRVQLATNVGNPPVSLLQQCCNMLSQGGKVQTKIGLLMIISVWLSNCPIAVSQFLNNSANVPYISAAHADESELLVQGMCAFVLGLCIQYSDDQSETFNKHHLDTSSVKESSMKSVNLMLSRFCQHYSAKAIEAISSCFGMCDDAEESLQRIIENRIGLETFHDKLQQVSKSELYTKAAKRAHLNYKQPNEVIFDHSFTKLFKEYEYELVKALQPMGEDGERKKTSTTSLKDHESIVDSYKHLIKEQDTELEKLREQLDELALFKQSSTSRIEQLELQLQELEDKNALLKFHKGLVHQSFDTDTDPNPNLIDTDNLGSLRAELLSLQTQLDSRQSDNNCLQSKLESLQLELNEKNSLIHTMSCSSSAGDKDKQIDTTVTKLETELGELKEMCLKKDNEIDCLNVQLSQYMNTTSLKAELHSATQTDTSHPLTQLGAVTEDRDDGTRVSELETRLAQLVQENKECHLQINILEENQAKLEKEKSRLVDEKRSLQEETESVKAEQDDLLVLLADQDAKLSTYRASLRELGHQVDEDEDEMDEIEDENDNDDDDDDDNDKD